jgi:UDP-N-acetylglucosamine 2-epimerase (non-hydrolysing)
LHRPSNVDNKERLGRLVELLREISQTYTLVFPLHPRTRNNLKKLGFYEKIEAIQNLKLLSPQGYFEFLKLMKEAQFVVTDSGGIQEETSYLNVPCITIRDNTERPVTCMLGTNTLVPFINIDEVPSILKNKLVDKKRNGSIPKWDGETASRIANILVEKLSTH